MIKAIIKKIFGGGSKTAAKNRLQFVLVQDRAGLSNEELTQFKKEILTVVQKYFVIDEAGFDVSYKRANDSTTLQINSPIVVKRQNTKSQINGAAVNNASVNGVNKQNSNNQHPNNKNQKAGNNSNNNQNKNTNATVATNNATAVKA